MNTTPIKIIPTYACLVDPMIAVFQNEHTNYESFATAREMFMHLAETVDRLNEERDARIAEYEQQINPHDHRYLDFVPLLDKEPES